MKKIELFLTLNNGAPFEEWFDKLTESAQVRIDKYIKRVAQGGSKKNIRSLGDGTFEIKVDYGPGYRVYFGEAGGVMILLLLGGNKSTQKRDILTAKKYWRLYNEKN